MSRSVWWSWPWKSKLIRSPVRIWVRHLLGACMRSLVQLVSDSVQRSTTVHTKNVWRGCAGLELAGYRHRFTPICGTTERFESQFPGAHLVISLLKSWLRGNHRDCVGAKHLQRYLDEFKFRSAGASPTTTSRSLAIDESRVHTQIAGTATPAYCYRILIHRSYLTGCGSRLALDGNSRRNRFDAVTR